CIVYANSLANGFVFDDNLHVLGGPLLRSLTNLPRIMRDYRPLRDVTYALDFAIWGGPWAPGFHLTNVVIHVANVALVFYLIRRMTGRLEIAVIAAAIFAVHPIQTDAVTYVSGRRDVLFAVFYIPSFLCYLKFHETRAWKYLVLFFVFWGLSLLSKEMAASLPFLIFVWSFCELWEQGGSGKSVRALRSFKRTLHKDRWLYVGLTAVTIPYIFYQVFLQGGSQRAGYKGFQYWGGTFYTNLLTEMHVQGWFLKQLVYPTPIAQYQGAFKVSTSLADWRVLLSMAAVISLLVIGVVLLDKARLGSFAIFSYFALLLPVSQIIPHHELLADHYLYLPMMSVGMGIGIAAFRLASIGQVWRTAVYTTLGLSIVTCGVLTIRRNVTWKDDFVFWKTNYEAVPESPRATFSLAVQYMNLNPQKAKELFKECLAIDPTQMGVYTDMAMMLNNREDAIELEGMIGKGLAQPDERIKSVEYQSPLVYRASLTAALGMAKSAAGDRAGAEKLLWRATDIYPANPEVYDLLYGFYGKDPARQVDVLKKELKFLGSNEDALKRMIFFLIKDRKHDEAIPYIQRLLRTNANDVYANYQMGRIFLSKGDCQQARSYLTRANSRASAPDDVSAAREVMKQLERQCGQS
ncbi:MAG: glycosyltransferase family 39 protein, partial [Blastocatellia bacterium]